VTALRAVVTALRQTEAASLSELDESVLKQTRERHVSAVLQRCRRSCRGRYSRVVIVGGPARNV